MTIPQVPIQLLVEAKENKADMYINGDITKGFRFFGYDLGQETDVSYQSVVEALNDLSEDVSDLYVHINSYGGEVAEGVAIYNALKSHSAKVTTVCEGFACSIASVIFMAGDDRIMRDSSLLMLHNASMCAAGDANDHRKAADDLDVITELSKTAYLNHAKGDLTREKLTEIMDAETWIGPEQALEWGLATEIDKPADEDEPTQSARELIAQRLVETPNSQFMTEQQCRGLVVRLALTQEQANEIAERCFERISQIVQKDEDENDEDEDKDEKPNTDDGDGDDADTDTDKDDDEDKRKRSNQRFARIFEKLSNM